MNVNEIIDALNTITKDGRHLGNWLTQTTTLGTATTSILDLPDGQAIITLQPTIRASGRQKWIADVSYKGKQVHIVSELSGGDAINKALAQAGVQ